MSEHGRAEERTDGDARDRLTALEESWAAAIVRQDRRYRRVAYGTLLTGLLVLLTVAAGFVAQRANQRANDQRRSESCRLFERQELAAKRQLVERYDYLARLPVADYGSTITRAIVRGLPAQYEDAVASTSPSYCDEPGVGLPEEGPSAPPALPPRPCPPRDAPATREPCRNFTALMAGP